MDEVSIMTTVTWDITPCCTQQKVPPKHWYISAIPHSITAPMSHNLESPKSQNPIHVHACTNYPLEFCMVHGLKAGADRTH